MIYGPKTLVRQLAAALLAVLLAACGSGDDPVAAGADDGRVISGNSSKGPLNGAIVRAFSLDARGQKIGAALGEAVTDASGNWTMTLPPGSQPLLIESSGGAYVDEADPEPVAGQRRTVQLAGDDVFATLLPVGASIVAINIYTDALLRKSRYETQGDNFIAVYDLNRSFFIDAFGFDIVTTPPEDPIQPDRGASLNARQYAMALGGIANAVNALATENQLPAPTYAVIAALIDDMTDCTVDGRGVGGPVSAVTTMDLSLNSEILRFRNNNFAAYEATPLLQLDQTKCARSALLPDVTAPVFADFPNNFTVEAPDGQGIDVNAATVQRVLQQVVAVDDRDGPLEVVSNLAGLLPPGATTVTFSASDQAGNTQLASLVITVVAPEPPSIVAPPDVIIRGVPPQPVQVFLGTPQVSDNVSLPADLVVVSDAPASGFSRGRYVVQWTVTDEVGLSAVAEQRVYIGVSPETDPTAAVDPDFVQEPTLSGNSFLTPVQRPGSGAARQTDTDSDTLPDVLELLLGSNFLEPDTDGDGLDDGFELAVGLPLTIVSPAAWLTPGAMSQPWTDSDSAQRRILLVAEGVYQDPIILAPPCDGLVLAGTGSGVAVSALMITGCRNVLVYRVSAAGRSDTLRVIDSTVTLRESHVATADAGAALLFDSTLYLETGSITGEVVVSGDSELHADCYSVFAPAGDVDLDVQARRCPSQ
ncbi:MAG: HYR domain-containing protein [Gammaproteobacteria bacterium]|nr:HYR domain-containing protein [Gammaproteobacteria bacterium]